MQSSAYVPRCMHGNFTNLGSFATLSATRYFVPSFSNSPITQSVTCGTQFAYKQSIIPFTRSILFLMEKLIKFVSTKTEYGGLIDALCSLNMCEETASMRLIFISFSFDLNWFLLLLLSCPPLFIRVCCLASFGFKRRLVSANFFVLRTFLPIVYACFLSLKMCGMLPNWKKRTKFPSSLVFCTPPLGAYYTRLKSIPPTRIKRAT